MLFTAGASANWITGEPSIMAVNGGEAAFHTSLSSAQRLDINLTSGTSGKADMIFSAEGYDDSLTLSSLPVKAVTETGTNGATYTDSKVTVTPLINDGNGQRFYLVDTGDGLGMTIVAYSKGSFKTAFSTSSLPETTEPVLSKYQRKQSSSTARTQMVNPPTLLHTTRRQDCSTQQRMPDF